MRDDIVGATEVRDVLGELMCGRCGFKRVLRQVVFEGVRGSYSMVVLGDAVVMVVERIRHSD